jgi:hypothetical protein
MLQNLLDYLQLDLIDALESITPIVLALVVSYVLGIFIFLVYKKTFRGVVYSQSFAMTLAAMTILTTMITLAISSNIALSLGMVGALSIVRYRTAIKDPVDILFLFWAVASGITIGAKLHYLAFVGSIIVIIMLITINRNISNNVYILVVHYDGGNVDEEIKRILRGNRFKVKSKTVRKDSVEMAAEVVVKRDNLAFIESIQELENVNDVALIQYSGDYNG